jgi:S-adenosylmethionine hydrolase
MPIVTLTTDFGTLDPYVGMLKGALLSMQPSLQLVDISHDIPSFDIVQAAYVLGRAWPEFPKGTIHLVSVNPSLRSAPRFMAFEEKAHYFIGPDNGLFSLVHPQLKGPVYELEFKGAPTFPQKQLFADAVGYLSNEKPIHEIGFPIEDMEQKMLLQPVVNAQQIRGTVMYIDKYGNAITNISETLFRDNQKKRNFAIYFKRHEPITQIHLFYGDVPPGEPLALFTFKRMTPSKLTSFKKSRICI